MLTTSSLKLHPTLTMDPSNSHAGIGSVFAAAVVSGSFREVLLTNPEQALQQGYMGKRFALSPEDAALIASISAKSLPDLAQQVVHTLSR